MIMHLLSRREQKQNAIILLPYVYRSFIQFSHFWSFSKNVKPRWIERCSHQNERCFFNEYLRV